MNAALRREVLFYTTSGIIKAVEQLNHVALLTQQQDSSNTEQPSPPLHVQHLALLPQELESLSTETQNQNESTRNIQNIDTQHPATNGTNNRISSATSSTSKLTKTFHDYEPHAFRRIRDRFGVKTHRYVTSLSSTAKGKIMNILI
jgi:1-phosphatidylinositol-4-phosphate 5-kinase